ncbi:MAG TPA: tetratricopeptide repeat protein, partial [Chthonomonadaceae bacterium]|nr:tetratricopeptide repeat protein [Chthonomonadaceae bacterium]
PLRQSRSLAPGGSVSSRDWLERTGPPPLVDIGYANTLPLPFTRFFGRETELSRLQALLRLPQTRLLTLTGPAGTGKTRLAIEVAARLWEAFAGAVWFVSLADLTKGRQIPERLRNALPLPRAENLDPLEQALTFLTAQPSLLVLDNFEHLVDEGAAIVPILLSRAPALTCLVTSRCWLGLTGEHEFFVSPLPAPHGEGTPEQLSVYESVQLFVDRAQTVKPDFQLTAGNAAAIARLCAYLEGIPLALELATARALVMTPSQIAAQLDRRFDLLVSRKRDVAERHRTLRAAIDWSYTLLPPELQTFFVQLSVFRGGWNLEAAESVCEQPLALDYLTQLRECSLVMAESSEDPSEIRFRMLETLREYAEEKWAPEQKAALQQRHFAYFLSLAEWAVSKYSSPEQASALDQLQREHDNLRAALRWSREAAAPAESEEEHGEQGLRLAVAMGHFWYWRGHLSEGRKQLADSLACRSAARPTSARAWALMKAGMLALAQSDFAEARICFEEMHSIHQALRDTAATAEATMSLGFVTAAQCDYRSAQTLYEQCLVLYRELGSKEGIARALEHLGFVIFEMGDYLRAQALQEQSLALKREMGEIAGITTSLFKLGRLAAVRGDLARAKTLYEECLSITKELGDRHDLAGILHNLGNVAYQQGDPAEARRWYDESLVVCHEIGNRFWEAITLHDLGTLAFDQGEVVTAKTLYAQSLRLKLAMGDRLGMIETIKAFAGLAAACHQVERAARLFGAGSGLRGELGTPRQQDQYPSYDRHLEAVRQSLGEPAFETAWREGKAMDWQQVADYALEETSVAEKQ